MLECEGYKMFHGTMMVTPIGNVSEVTPFEVEGTFLYKPEYDCWYVNGVSYPAKICCVWEDEDDLR